MSSALLRHRNRTICPKNASNHVSSRKWVKMFTYPSQLHKHFTYHVILVIILIFLVSIVQGNSRSINLSTLFLQCYSQYILEFSFFSFFWLLLLNEPKIFSPDVQNIAQMSSKLLKSDHNTLKLKCNSIFFPSVEMLSHSSALNIICHLPLFIHLTGSPNFPSRVFSDPKYINNTNICTFASPIPDIYHT